MYIIRVFANGKVNSVRSNNLAGMMRWAVNHADLNISVEKVSSVDFMVPMVSDRYFE